MCTILVAVFSLDVSGHSSVTGEAVAEGNSAAVQEPTAAASKAVNPSALTK